nr:MAG TPA: hypothetical protein [Bacteriophage sp.]
MSFSITQAISVSQVGTQFPKYEVDTLNLYCHIHDVRQHVPTPHHYIRDQNQCNRLFHRY